MTRRLVPAVVVIVVTNLVLLSLARSNRRGDPDAILRLTERELRMTSLPSDRNSAVELVLSAPMAEGDWLSGPKLAALGFDTRLPPNQEKAADVIRRQIARRVFGVFEFEGPAWTRHVEQEQQRRRLLAARGDSPETRSQIDFLDRSLEADSRLFVVDASTDPEALRRQYPDRSRYAVLPSTVHVFPSVRGDGSAGSKTQLGGQLRPVTTAIVVPVTARDVLDRVKAGDAGGATWPRTPARYTVTLAIGRRLEPWIVSVDAIDTPQTRH